MDWRHGGKDLYWVQHVGVDTWTQIKREHPRRLLSNTGLVSEERDWGEILGNWKDNCGSLSQAGTIKVLQNIKDQCGCGTIKDTIQERRDNRKGNLYFSLHFIRSQYIDEGLNV